MALSADAAGLPGLIAPPNSIPPGRPAGVRRALSLDAAGLPGGGEKRPCDPCVTRLWSAV
eukprot:8087144-Alexandrium_andersonii.AAC.1